MILVAAVVLSVATDIDGPAILVRAIVGTVMAVTASDHGRTNSSVETTTDRVRRAWTGFGTRLSSTPPPTRRGRRPRPRSVGGWQGAGAAGGSPRSRRYRESARLHRRDNDRSGRSWPMGGPGSRPPR